MKKFSLVIGALMAFGAVSAQTPAEEPIITFKTNIYETYGATNSFHFRMGATETAVFDVDCGYGPIECEITPATFDQDAQDIVATSVSCQVSSEGIVKIYGDASLVDYFDGEGCYIDWIDLDACTNLDVLDLQHNELKRLDLSAFRNLSAIYLTDNPFTEATPLVIGPDHPRLTILEVDIVTYISPDFDITTYPELVSFDAYANKTLSHLDPTKCPKLMRLSLDSCPIKSVDVSKNPLLAVLNVEDSGISELDLSNNPNLSQLYVTHESGFINTDAKFTKLDISKNTALRYLAASGNRLESIDLSNNPQLDYISLANNNLTALDVSANTLISTLNVKNNNMTFATLPMPDENWYEYTYQQRPMEVARSYAEGTVLDFSDKVLREGTRTDAVLYGFNTADNEAVLLDPSYYSYEDGKVTLHKAYSDSVYVSFGNTAFPEMLLATTKFMVKTAAEFGQPTAIASFTTSVADGQPLAMHVGVLGATAESPREVLIDFGDGNLETFTVTTSSLGDAPNVVGTKKGYGTVKVYMPENEVLWAFGTEDVPMYSFECDAATEIRQLMLRGAGLYTIDLAYNRDLRKLDLSHNNLSTLTLEGVNGMFNKNVLGDINLSYNNLSDVTLNDPRAIFVLNLSHNNFSEFGYKEFEYVTDLDFSYNKLRTINLAYFTAAESIDISHNELTEMMMPETNVMKHFDISGNKFTIATIPLMPEVAEYIYAPQADIILPAKGPGANLSSQERVIDGVGTTFTWKKADGTPVAEGDVEVDGGKTRFINTDLGEIYCEMTNPAFPEFGGDTPFRTTLIETAGMPTNKIAEFTTPVGGETVSLSLAAADEGTAVYIDWAGEGYDFEQYQLGTSYTLFSATTVKGATARVYTYSADDKLTVFSMGGAKMGTMDASPMTDLICFSLEGAGLTADKLIMPASAGLEELSLDGNAFESLDLEDYPGLRSLSLSNNKFTSLDLSGCKNLQFVGVGNNSLTDVTLGNPALWFLDLSGNNLESVDLSGVPRLEQLSLSHNSISSIDITPLSSLRQMLLDHNKFTFATLPLVKSSYYQYVYIDQADLHADCIDGKVDLASQAMVDGVATEYRWFIERPEFDEYGELAGEELVAGEEYTLENGVTTFMDSFTNVVCVMTNTKFPNLYLFTETIGATQGINDAAADAEGIAVTVVGNDIHVSAPGCADGTPVGVVALDGRTVASAALSNGTAVLRGIAPGVAVVAVGNRAAKVLVK